MITKQVTVTVWDSLTGEISIHPLAIPMPGPWLRSTSITTDVHRAVCLETSEDPDDWGIWGVSKAYLNNKSAVIVAMYVNKANNTVSTETIQIEG